MAYGYVDTSQLPQTTQPVDFQAVWRDLQEGLGLYNQSSGWLMQNLCYKSQDAKISYAVGAMAFERATEMAEAKRQRVGWGLADVPVFKYDLGLGFTWDMLQEATRGQIDSMHAAAMQADQDNVIRQIVQKCLRAEAETIISPAGESFTYPAFCNGSGFTPPNYEGKSFAATHQHFARVASGSLDAGIKTLRDNLGEHGHKGNLILLISDSDRATVEALTNFKLAAGGLYTPGASTDIATVNANEYIGVIHSFKVRVCTWMPQYYIFGFNAAGSNNVKNPLRWRWGAIGDGLKLIQEDESRTNPLINAFYKRWFGLGVGQRTNGGAIYVAASGDYVTPTL